MRHILLLLLTATVLYSCGKDSDKTEEILPGEKQDVPVDQPKERLSFQLLETASFPDASIELYRPLGNEQFEPGKVPFEFNVKNYPFGRNRPLMLAINGANPVSQEQAIFSKEFNTGTYRVVAFLTDEEGHVLKEYGNHVDRDFLVGNSRPFPAADEPYLMVNLPRDGDELEVDETLKIDFLLVGGDMEADKLEVLIEVGDFTYKTQKMETLQLDGLPKGEHAVYVHLLSRQGKVFDSIFSSVRRNITIK